MFQFPRCPPRTLCIQVRVIRVHLIGFPHSDMSGSMLATSSPDLFAGDRVLHRPLAPRHSPRALRSLTYFQHPARPSRAGGCCSSVLMIGYGFALAKLACVSSSSSVVKVHIRSFGRVHDAREQARTGRTVWIRSSVGATAHFTRFPVETRRLELLTSSLQRRRSTS